MPCSSSGWGRSSPRASSSAADVELLQQLGLGFSVALQPINLFYCFVGVFIGTLVGVLPGIGPVGAMSLLLPATFKATPEASIIMLAGIYEGAMYGGSTTSILVNIPGEAASVVTCLDGYQMARQGRAGPALGMAAFASFIAGTLAIVGLMLLAPPLSRVAIAFGPAEYFSLMVLGLTILIYLAHGSIRSRSSLIGSQPIARTPVSCARSSPTVGWHRPQTTPGPAPPQPDHAAATSVTPARGPGRPLTVRSEGSPRSTAPAARAAACAAHAALDDALVAGAGSPQEPDQSRAVSAPGTAPGPAARRRWGLSGGPGCPLHGAT